MDPNDDDANVYGLVTELCRRFIDKNAPEKHPYMPCKDDTGALKKLRSRAFEILLNKSPNKIDHDDRQDADPLTELLKHAFVLKTALGQCSRAEELESLTDSLEESQVYEDLGTYSTLQFLVGVKSYERTEDDSLNIFYYGKHNPALPEQLQNPKGVPRYQVYPIESLVLPERFERMLGIRRHDLMLGNSGDRRSNLSFSSQFRSAATIGIESLGSEDNGGSMFSVPRYTVKLASTREFSMSSFFVPNITEDSLKRISEYSTGHIGSIPHPEPPWLCLKSACDDVESNSETSDTQLNAVDLNGKAGGVEELLYAEWDNVNDMGEVSEHRTWEALGRLNAPKEPPFITEQNEAMLHLERMSQIGYLFLLPRKIVDKIDPIEEISTRDLLKSIKLLLVGIESKNFTWDEKSRSFALRNNVMIPGLSVEATLSACTDVMHWGACYRSLSHLIKPDPWTMKRQHQGLIFKAMCNSIKELFVFYQAAVLRISLAHNESPALLKLLHHIKPMGELMSEVARLCRCDSDDQAALDDGLGLLSHIYDQVTRVTKPRVAMIFYSILKACCEVYFRMLERWIFDGNCDDAYGEFMIRQRPQFLHEKSHRFWTKAYALNGNSVPGFLSHLTDSIIECGKTVKLLKICDPKNPLCTMFATSHPFVRVCLSVGMVREQEITCSEILEKGEQLLGKNVSFSYAFEEQRIAEKNRAMLVVAAQHETLERIKREIAEAKLETARNKRELLAQLKDQAGEVASRKEREREAELIKDRQYLEDLNAAEEIARNAEMAEKKSVLEYYNELAVEAERRRARADWRVRRMKLFEQRANSIIGAEKELWGIEESDAKIDVENRIEKSGNVEDSMVEETGGDRDIPEAVESIGSKSDQFTRNEDENKNPTESDGSPEAKKTEAPDIAASVAAVDTEEETKILPKKSPRPCVLEITSTTTTTANLNLNDRRQTQDNGNIDDSSSLARIAEFDTAENRTAAQRNKLKIWQQEYGMTPNNNEFNIIVVDAEGNQNTICIDASTVDPDNLRSTAKIVTNRNENRDYDSVDAWRCEVTGERLIRGGDNLTEAQRNRNRNMAHYTEALEGFVEPDRTPDIASLSEAQRNMRRNMTHTYRDDPPEREPSSRVNFTEYTELQKNRARVMGHDNRNYHDHGFEDVGADCLNPLTPMSQLALDDGMTPMSCTTDTFLTSISSSLTHEDLAKIAARSTATPGGLSSDEPTESRPTSSGFDFPRSTQAYPNFIGRDAAAEPSFKSSLTIADVEMIDNTSLQVYLEKSVAIPLRVQSRLANAAMVKYFIYELNVLSHFHSLRRFFFLLDGEFARSLTSSLYKRLYDIAAPIELFRSATLTNLLKNALGSSINSANDNSTLLSLSAMSIPSQLQLSNPEFLNCLCLHYKISWPLNIVFDERVMEQYSKVFKFLVMVGRVLYVLQVDFNILKVERKAATSDQYHKLQLYRHSMMQFITAFHNYLTCSVLHASWSEFEKDLGSATTLDQIYLTHVAYIKKILSRCMLTARGEKMRTFLCNIFKVILKFHNGVRSQNWSTIDGGYAHANFERLEQMYKTFCEARAYLAHVAEKLASSGYQPHLTHFLNALNINPLYDLAHMHSSKKT